MEQAAWRRHHGGGIMEDASWRRRHGGGIVEEASWRRHHGGGMEEAGITWLASYRGALGSGGIQVASEGIPGLAKPRRVSQDDLRDMAS